MSLVDRSGTGNLDPARCKADVHEGGRSIGFHQCLRRATRKGYCFQHHPEAVAARERVNTERWEREQAMLHWSYKRGALEGSVVRAARRWYREVGVSRTHRSPPLPLCRLTQAIKRLLAHEERKPGGKRDEKKS